MRTPVTSTDVADFVHHAHFLSLAGDAGRDGAADLNFRFCLHLRNALDKVVARVGNDAVFILAGIAHAERQLSGVQIRLRHVPRNRAALARARVQQRRAERLDDAAVGVKHRHGGRELLVRYVRHANRDGNFLRCGKLVLGEIQFHLNRQRAGGAFRPGGAYQPQQHQQSTEKRKNPFLHHIPIGQRTAALPPSAPCAGKGGRIEQKSCLSTSLGNGTTYPILFYSLTAPSVKVHAPWKCKMFIEKTVSVAKFSFFPAGRLFFSHVHLEKSGGERYNKDS